MAELVTRGQVLNASGGILSEKQLKALLQEIAENKKFADKPEAIINQALVAAFKEHRLGMKMMEGEEFPFRFSYFETAYDKLASAVEAGAKAATKPMTHSERVVNEIKVANRITDIKPKVSSWKQLKAGDQITIGSCLLIGTSFFLSGASRAQAAVTKNEEGKTQVNPTSMTIALGEMAAGIAAAVFAHHVYRGAATR